ncbi:hypothetical protein CGCSCA4_v001676 [Colletotrichum siamense]|uniref:Uncharacterized protein n=1 Tax=Colletotrichum siamense TaxID=690259 RepID=A0A9P5KAE8_COLSI|nr:hypothetical protein CGCSCA4_v001676 [Colletotrichum siamense]KAF4864646.1 hypothetical protein CGCSCA2_v001812 [Colletotrichum siamense]
MPPKKTPEAGAAATHNCSESDIKLMVAIFELIPRPSMDYDALAEKLGSASANAARMRVTAAVNKHTTWFAGVAGAATNEDGTPTKKPRAKRTPKKKAPSDEEEGDAQEQETPSKKKPRVSKAKAKAKVEEDVDDEAVQLEEPVKQEAGDGAAEAEI